MSLQSSFLPYQSGLWTYVYRYNDMLFIEGKVRQNGGEGSESKSPLRKKNNRQNIKNRHQHSHIPNPWNVNLDEFRNNNLQ